MYSVYIHRQLLFKDFADYKDKIFMKAAKRGTTYFPNVANTTILSLCAGIVA